MKNLTYLFAFLLMGSFCFSSCSSSRGVSTYDEPSQQTKLVGQGQSNNNLADFMRKNTSLNIQGQHPNVKIDIRGINTIKGDARPYFIVDGIRLGRSYVQANNAVNLTNVRRIRVLRSLSELAVYGEDGVNGVIIIDHAN